MVPCARVFSKEEKEFIFQTVTATGKFLAAWNLGQVCPVTSKFVQDNAKSLL